MNKEKEITVYMSGSFNEVSGKCIEENAEEIIIEFATKEKVRIFKKWIVAIVIPEPD